MAILMGITKDFVEIVAKEKLLVYFLMLWAGSFFFWAMQNIAEWGFIMSGVGDYMALIGVLLELAAGVALALFAAKSLKSDFIGALSKERLLMYFVLLWAGSFFFWAIHDIDSFGPYALEFTEDAMGLIAALFDLAAGAVLALLGWKLLKAKEPRS